VQVALHVLADHERSGAVIAGRTDTDDDWVTSSSRRRFRAGLFRYPVCGIPLRPVRVGLADALLMFAVRDRRAPHRAR
jgi:hypothetical protein